MPLLALRVLKGSQFSMLHLGTHTLCGKVGSQAASFTAAGMGAEWSQRSEQITRPVASVEGYNKPESLDTTGAEFGDGGTVL